MVIENDKEVIKKLVQIEGRSSWFENVIGDGCSRWTGFSRIGGSTSCLVIYGQLCGTVSSTCGDL
ncbi:hypothetical protein F383_03204 [Gossypium arboreum]|uniref:Uncharacterized protein n=1 Tax=Gossypium arboreum TaxID=29729 RepID=A0A0B0PPM6_GOSAR|nr:hypothetical protein F383_03204 [Gossypium arboreum]